MQGWLIRLMHASVRGGIEGQSQYFDQMRTWLVRGIEAGSNHPETLDTFGYANPEGGFLLASGHLDGALASLIAAPCL